VRKGIVLAIMGGFAAVACLFGVVIAFGLLLFGGGGSTKPPCDLTGTTSISAIAPPNNKCDEGPLSSTGKATYDDIVGAANQLDQMHVPYSYGGGHVTPARPSAGDSGIGMDCSASVSWVLQHAGFKLPTMVSGHGGFMDWGEPGPGKKVTIYAYSGHVFMKIGDRYFGTSGFGHPEAGTGAAWFTRPLFSGYLAEFGFVARHPHGL
jgi:hypothetical protein